MNVNELIPSVSTDLTTMPLDELRRMKEDLSAQRHESLSHFKATGKTVLEAGNAELFDAVIEELKRRAKIANAD